MQLFALITYSDYSNSIFNRCDIKTVKCPNLSNWCSVFKFKNIIIAYEPVWAIGTGLNANTAQIEEAHIWIRNVIQNLYGETLKNHILYGGSVNQNNAAELINVPSVDGFLIGGASLDSKTFSMIIKTVQSSQEKKV